MLNLNNMVLCCLRRLTDLLTEVVRLLYVSYVDFCSVSSPSVKKRNISERRMSWLVEIEIVTTPIDVHCGRVNFTIHLTTYLDRSTSRLHLKISLVQGATQGMENKTKVVMLVFREFDECHSILQIKIDYTMLPYSCGQESFDRLVTLTPCSSHFLSKFLKPLHSLPSPG